MSDATYSKRGAAVVIQRPFEKEIILDEPNLEWAIGNIKKNRSVFATEEAYQAHLDIYLDAQRFLREAIDRAS